MRALAMLFSMAAVVILGSGCASEQVTDAPRVALAASTQAQRDLRVLEEKWEIAGEVGRKELRSQLEEFLRRYPTDPSGARARIMLARIALSERRLGSAAEILQPLLSSELGAAHDEALVVRAAVDNRAGDHEMALARLEPLEGKLLTRSARDSYARETILAALALRRWRVAMDAMAAWLSRDNGGVVENQHWVKDAMVKVPARALSRILSGWSSQEDTDDPGRQWLMRAMIEHLTDVALANQDPLLARDLLASAPPFLRASKHGQALSLLAATAQQDARIMGRAIGVVLGGKDVEQRRRAVRVSAGVLHGLGGDANGGSSGEAESSIRFVAAEDRGSLSAALSTLIGLGASVLVAGTDPTSAELALSFAESKEVPVVVMSEPRSSSRRLRYGFIAGTSETTQLVALESARREIRAWRFIGTLETPCQGEALPWGTFKAEDVQAIGVLGDEMCMRRVLRNLGTQVWEPFVAVGLESARGPFPAGQDIWHLSAGSYPKTVRFLSDQISEAERHIAEGNAPLSPDPFDWYFSLGFDVARLARQALSSMPESQITDKDAVHAHHKLARDVLEKAQVDLISTNERGFSRYHRLERRLVLRQALPRPTPAP